MLGEKGEEMAYSPNAKLKPSTTKKYEEGKKMYLEGKSIEQIALTLHLERRKFSYYLKDNGIEVKNPTVKRKLNESYFASIDTEEKAYWLGFLYADGCVSVRTRNGKEKSINLEVGLKESDEEHLVKLAKSLSYENYKISHRERTNSVRIVICSTKLCRDLIDKGCVPNKSLKLQFPDFLPLHLVDHFIRGYIDGDGYVGVRQNKTSQTLRIGVIGTLSMLEGIIKHFDLQAEDYNLRHDKRHSEAIHSIEFNKNATLKIAKIYKDSKIHLTRKYDLVLPFIENVD